MAASSSTAASSNNNQLYQVFINYRGVDTKETFARPLYFRLLQRGLRAFLDMDEMQPGYEISSQIGNAIRTASVHVAIFSARYAESFWCLDELLLMLESKVPIIPVFYGVSPSEVRWTRGKDGIYAKALKRLAEKRTDESKQRYNPNTIENWRNALSQVADISGFELKECDIGKELEGKLLYDLVKHLSKMMKKSDLHVAKFPTGLDEKLKDFEDKFLLDVGKFPTGLDEKLKDFEDTVLLPLQQSGRPQRLGIWGLGGVGKTTLAKEFFNRNQSAYPISCFLVDLGENVIENSLVRFQRHFHKDLTGLDKPIDDVEEGKDMLKGAIEHTVSKVLVILDDVDHPSQVDALLPVDLPSGSLIVITSRNKDVLLCSKVENSSIYRLTGLNQQYSRQLFCSYAFNQTYPPREFENVVNKFLDACNGLPLSLKVIGARLCGGDIYRSEHTLIMLSKSLPSDIEKRLRISYDALDEYEQQMFLDIACFFTGENMNIAISIWDASGWEGRWGFQSLQDNCLVEVDSENVIHMHNHLIALGRDVAEESSPHRLWRWTKGIIADLLHQSPESVRGIQMHHDEDDVIGVTETENALPERILRTLQILSIKGERLLRTMELPSILWLSWINCPYSSLPSGISMKNLRLLRVSGSSELEELPISGTLVPLEVLQADGCVKLKSIRGLAQLAKLRLLSISGCSELEELPSMEALIYLEELRAADCVKLKRIRGLEHATKLQKLSVTGCSELQELPSMEGLVCLEELRARDCVKLKRIRGLEHATKLQKLSVTGCSELEELPTMEALVCLEELRARDCVKLKRIRGLEQATKLQKLSVTGCSELEELPISETLVHLEVLQADGCVKLKSIRGLAQLTKLRLLSISGYSELEELPSMEALICLEELRAADCVKLKRIRGLEEATKLQKLSVEGCSELEELPRMEALVCLEKLWASDCVKLKRIRGLEHATKLQKLCVTGCSELEELPTMEALVCLEELRASDCVKLKRIRGLEQATKLQKLCVTGCSELEELPTMEALECLEELRARDCVKLKRIRGLEQATKLQKLSVTGCSELQEMPSMEGLVCLEELRARDCVKLKRIRGLEHATKLQKLSVTGCSELEELPSMEALVCLEELQAKDCVKLERIRGLEHATKLQKLSVTGCSELQELPSMEGLVCLKELRARDCVKLKRIMGLEHATMLQNISVAGCSELEELPSMKALVRSEELRANACVKLKRIRGLAAAKVQKLKAKCQRVLRIRRGGRC